MRKVRAVVFVATGTLLGLLLLDGLVFFLTSGDAKRYVLLLLWTAGSVACFRAALADWRHVSQGDGAVPAFRSARRLTEVVFAVMGTLLALVVALEVRGLFYFHNASWVRNAPWATRAVLLGFPVVFGLGAVACFRTALNAGRSRTKPTASRGLMPGS
ncbi:MAG: hypothetical protein ACLPVY_00515 [Acidimicrobiia bacterium]